MKPMKRFVTKRLLGAAILSAALITPAVASAQDYAYGGDQQIQGTISSINGTWNISVDDDNGYVDSIELHQGTIINPTGLTLEPGMNVTIDGYADGPNFDAMEIDTPYQYEGPAPEAVYYGAGVWYPGYAEGWGPSFSLVFNVGTRSWVRRPFAFGGQVRRPIAPPSGWQNRPHGYIGAAGGGFPHVAYATQRRYPQAQAAPQRQFSAPAPQQRRFSAPQQPQRQFSAPQQPQRQFSAPAPQQRQFSAPQRPQQHLSPPANRGGQAPAQRGHGDEHRRG